LKAQKTDDNPEELNTKIVLNLFGDGPDVIIEKTPK
jgi:hypothetical protein